MYNDPAGTEKEEAVSTPQGDSVVNIIVRIFKELSKLAEKAFKSVTKLGEIVGTIINEIFVCLDLQELSKKLNIDFHFDSLWDYLEKKVYIYTEAFNKGIVKFWTSVNEAAINFSNWLSKIFDSFGETLRRLSTSFSILPYITTLIDDISGRYLSPKGSVIMLLFDFFINGIIDVGSVIVSSVASPIAGVFTSSALEYFASKLGTREKAEFYAYNWFYFPILFG